MKLSLTPLPERFVVAQLTPDQTFQPAKGLNWSLYAAIFSPDEISIVCPEEDIPKNARIESGWRALKIIENLDFSLVGVLADISTHLAQAGISIFVISTFNTDYILVKEQNFDAAIIALLQAGYTITGRQ